MLLSHPAFQLFSATLYETVQQGVMQSFVKSMKKEEQFRKLELNEQMVPIALRWTTHPEFGFPRKPFKVFRRRASYAGQTIINPVKNASENIVVMRTFTFASDVYVMAVSCTIPAGQSLILTPLGKDNIEMKAKSYKMESSGTILFKAPFMIGLLCEGVGVMNNLSGVAMEGIIQADDWEHIQTVGFPFEQGEVGGLGYESDPQGFAGIMMTGKEAGLLRLKIGEALFIPPNSVNAADSMASDVTWQHPDAERYMDFLRKEQLEMINMCLTKCDDFSFNRSRRQAGYFIKTTIAGVSQTGLGSAQKDAEVTIPVVSHTVLAVSNESPAALGLGFGTYDFVPQKLARQNAQASAQLKNDHLKMVAVVNQNFSGFDYMVTAEYVIRPYEKIVLTFLDDISKEIEFCALNDERARPVTPTELEAFGLQINRPESMDEHFTETVKLRWNQSNIPHGYGLVSSYEPMNSNILNDTYDFQKHCYKNLFTPVPKINGAEQDLEDIGKFTHIESDEPVPFFGTESHKYFFAGWDVFGRWSQWARCGHTAVAPLPQQAIIMSLSLNLAEPNNMYALLPNQPNVACKLEIDFGWDWIDRSPSEIQLAGNFFNAALKMPPAGIPGYFSIAAGDTVTDIISIKFNTTNQNTLPVASHGSISIMEPNTPAAGSSDQSYGSSDVPSANLKRYKLIVDVNCSFPGSAPFEVAYAAFIRGLETVRKPANNWSAWQSGYTTRLSDPRPPAVTVLPATVQFTAVADAAKIARGRLEWPVAAGALVYNLWEASETAIRVVVEEKLKTQFPSDQSKWLLPLSASLTDRATQLRDLLKLSNYANACQRSFSRLSKTPIQTTHYELALPGSSDGLFLYQVSSVNGANIESAKSNVVFFAVPKVVTPSAPMIQIRPYKKTSVNDPDGEGFEIKVVKTTGESPAGFQLFKTRKRIIDNDPGMKGPPVLEHTAAQWKDATINLLDGTVYSGKKINELNLTRSWKPFVYQAVAIGKNDPDRGKISGMSEGSTTEIVYFTPKEKPSIVALSDSSNAHSNVFVVSTNAPFERVELGKTIIELFSIDAQNKRTLIKTFIASETERSTTQVKLAANVSEAAQFPQIRHHATSAGTGITNFSVGIAGNVVKIILKITDPLNRASEILLES